MAACLQAHRHRGVTFLPPPVEAEPNMIISHLHRYVFIEVPQTASTALATELIENYDGHRILLKHSDYAQFFRSASPDERSFRVLATIRNPLDIVVSKFVKARNDHKNLYANHKIRGAPWGFRFRPEARERAFIAKRGPDFDRFVRHFYPRAYNNRACLLPSSAQVMRYENLNDDFAGWLKASGVAMVRVIPPRNQTTGRARDFTEWYSGRSSPARGYGVWALYAQVGISLSGRMASV